MNFRKNRLINQIKTYLNRPFRFSSIKDSYPYPYIFGGLPSPKFVQENIYKSVSEQIFGEDIKKILVAKYIDYLSALKLRDKIKLQQMVSPELIRKITYEQVDQVYSEAPIDIIIDTQIMVFGAGLNRLEHRPLKYWRSKNDGFIQMYISKQYGMKQKILFSAKVLFKSKRKLIRRNNSQNCDNSEVHCLQMEFETERLNVLRIYPILLKKFISSALTFQPLKQIEVFKQFLDVNKPKWKITDADLILKGNFPTLIHKQNNQNQ